nr:RNA-directed DNA polymerase, eukaryota [Tanacetum cinerariifolium]
MKSLRRDFFYGMYGDVSKIVWVKWSKRYVSCDGSLWFRVINAIHGSYDQVIPVAFSSNWSSIVKEVSVLKNQCIDFLSHCKIRVGNGMATRFWKDTWLGESCLRHKFPRLFALENDKDCKVAAKGTFCVKDFRNLLDEFFLPKSESSTRWIKSIPIKVNIFAWRVSIDRLPTRHNLVCRGVSVPFVNFPMGCIEQEDLDHVLFRCELASGLSNLVCRWWNQDWIQFDSYRAWLAWFKAIRIPSSSKGVL